MSFSRAGDQPCSAHGNKNPCPIGCCMDLRSSFTRRTTASHGARRVFGNRPFRLWFWTSQCRRWDVERLSAIKALLTGNLATALFTLRCVQGGHSRTAVRESFLLGLKEAAQVVSPCGVPQFAQRLGFNL